MNISLCGEWLIILQKDCEGFHGLCKERVRVVSYEELAIFTKKSYAQFGNQKTIISIRGGFKKKTKKLMEFSIKLAGWVLDAPVFKKTNKLTWS